MGLQVCENTVLLFSVDLGGGEGFLGCYMKIQSRKWDSRGPDFILLIEVWLLGFV